MAYYSGMATSYADCLNALTSVCISNGWIWENSILSKDGCFLSLVSTVNGITATGGTGKTGSTLLNPSYVTPRMGQPANVNLPVFPVSYHIFVFDNEIYFLIKFNINTFYYLAFGKSSIPLTESGLWISATSCGQVGVDSRGGITITSTGGGSGPSSTTSTGVGPFWNAGSFSLNNNNSVILNGLDGLQWSDRTRIAVASSAVTPLQNRQPSTWSQEAVLLPINVFVARPSFKQSLGCQFENARFLRIDNFEPEQILTLGSESWMIFPFYKKDSSNRDGGGPIDHTGTFGWAIKYEGP